MIHTQVLRSIRVWAPRLAAPLAELEQGKAQLGLAHSYSRAKVKFNVNRVDNMIIQVPVPRCGSLVLLSNAILCMTWLCLRFVVKRRWCVRPMLHPTPEQAVTGDDHCLHHLCAAREEFAAC